MLLKKNQTNTKIHNTKYHCSQIAEPEAVYLEGGNFGILQGGTDSEQKAWNKVGIRCSHAIGEKVVCIKAL